MSGSPFCLLRLTLATCLQICGASSSLILSVLFISCLGYDQFSISTNIFSDAPLDT